jgi:hypothetical protein
MANWGMVAHRLYSRTSLTDFLEWLDAFPLIGRPVLELANDYAAGTRRTPSESSISDLFVWSWSQTTLETAMISSPDAVAKGPHIQR